MVEEEVENEVILEEQVPPPLEERPERLRVQFAADLVDDGLKRTGGQQTPSVPPESTQGPHRYGNRRNTHNPRYTSVRLAKITQGETSEREQMDSVLGVVVALWQRSAEVCWLRCGRSRMGHSLEEIYLQ
eukprot:4401971-Amphidinium_carterae.3